MRQKKKLPVAMLAAAMLFGISGCAGNEAVSSSSTYIEEVSSAVISEPESSVPEIELPPVDVLYNEKADTNSDGTISKTEWKVWVKEHPEDANKDMVITPEEKQKYEDSQKPAVSSKPATPSKPSAPSSSKPTTSSKPSSSSKSKQDEIDAIINQPIGGEKMTPDEAYTEDQGVKPGF